MATIAQIVAQIRTAVFGKDVRENIAQGIEKCYDDVEDLVLVQANQPPVSSNNKIWLKPTGEEYVVFTSDDVATVSETMSYLNS